MVAALLLASFVAVTNHAGHVVSGELGSVTNGHFTVSGRTYPLSVLSASEQTRLKAAAGVDVRTPQERRIDEALAYELARIDARRAEGELTDGEAESLRRQSRAAAEFRRAKAFRAERPSAESGKGPVR